MGEDLTEELATRARMLAADVLAPMAEDVDTAGRWPSKQLQAIAEAGLMGLHVPKPLGGHGLGLGALARITEELATGCSSTAMCYAMHCVGTAVIAAKATPFQEQRYLAPIAQGRHITSLALSEPGTGANFYLPRATFRVTGRGFSLHGEKSFVTNGAEADSYVLSAVRQGDEIDPGAFTCLLVDSTAPALEWGPPWAGFGMRGNSSRRMFLNGTTIPAGNLIGSEGDQTWYVFEVVAPYFLVAMSGVYLGIAEAALRMASEHLQRRTHVHTGQALSEQPLLVEEIADLWRTVARTRQFVRYAAAQWDAGLPGANAALFAAKIEVAEASVSATNRAMALLGGRGYEEHGKAGRLMRDAQASHVMSPTTHILKTWLGRVALGLPPI